MTRAEEELASLGLQPLALDAKRAAAYVGMSARAFLAAVHAGTYPQPMRGPGKRRWNRLALEAAHGCRRADGDAIMGQIDEARAAVRREGQAVSLFPSRRSKGAAARGARQP